MEFVVIAILLLLLIALVLSLRLRPPSGGADLQLALRELQQQLSRLESADSQLRSEFGLQAASQRQELAAQLESMARGQREQHGQFGQQLTNQLQTFELRLAGIQSDLNVRVDALRQTVDEKLGKTHEDARAGREEMQQALNRFRVDLTEQLKALSQSSEQKLEAVRATVQQQLTALQTDNGKKLDEMRATVDEKLQATLEKRLGDSFKLVSDRLEQVHKGLGEMQTLASGVGDLKRVLTNVKTRGTWGEVQLGALLEQILAPEQYEANVATKPRASERVEYAIKLPGRQDEGQVWLPIDAKFPIEDYQRLLDAQERADAAGVEEASKLLENRLKLEARTIREKYVAPPHTTDFAILYLPTESLYAEVLRRPGLTELLQREHRITVAGPTTLAAMLNSLQMGFKTLAIEKRSSEVWQVLGAVKTEFGKFGEVLARTKKKLQETVNTIDNAETRTRQISRKLKSVEALPAAEAASVLGDSSELDEDSLPEDEG
ncbi:DNA recombination protein RmuC [Permianibacter sp. IMCC34836]|uniref:DNA recombination protein RmuC n=1 Tax=Permianibacter fluminis TaxID=2738515 RepID=UPI001556D36C|nr:DNA recombination protein RmuC [Permianibacter fluminis]NQD35705.1 DNA recombination protein RmuC [Permianibacter fluminis]